MGVWEFLPYTNIHNLNKGEIIKAINELGEEMRDFEAINKISYYGAFDITKNYSPWTIVDDNGIGYISIRSVPNGVPITDTNYWRMIVDYSALYADLGTRVDHLENIAPTYFTGKKIVSYGDSTMSSSGSYINLLPSIVDCTVVNRGVAGTRMNRMSNNGTSLINNSTDLGSFDIITLSYGTNEWQTNETVKQIYEDAIAIIEAIRNKNSKIEIIFITPFYSYREFGNNTVNLNNAGLFLSDVINVITFVMNNYNVPVIDFYRCSSCNKYNYNDLLLNDSGGIYVHPTAKFHNELVKILKNYTVGAIASSIEEDVLSTYDFYEGQSAFTNADYNNAGGLSKTGLFLHYGGTYTENSTMKTILSTSIYRIRCTTDTAFTLSSGAWSYNIPAGKTDIIVTDIPTGFRSFTIDTTAETIIEDLHIYTINLGGRIIPDATRFGARCKLTIVSADIEAVAGRYQPSVVFTPDSLVFDFAGFKVNNEVTAGDTLMSIPYNFTASVYLHGYLYTVKSSDGEVYPLEIQGNEVKALKNLPTGTYIISSTLTVDRNIALIN